MSDKPRIARAVVVAAGFALFIALGLGLAYVMGLFPTPAEACAEKCSALGKRGELVYVFRPEVTAGMRGKGPEECRCR
jgi:hypothetical protein